MFPLLCVRIAFPLQTSAGLVLDFLPFLGFVLSGSADTPTFLHLCPVFVLKGFSPVFSWV